MEIKSKEVDCIFFKKVRFPHNGVRGNPDWEPGCILKDYYCSCAFEKAEPCSGCVPSSERNKVCEILDVCLRACGLVIPEQEAKR